MRHTSNLPTVSLLVRPESTQWPWLTWVADHAQQHLALPLPRVRLGQRRCSSTIPESSHFYRRFEESRPCAPEKIR